MCHAFMRTNNGSFSLSSLSIYYLCVALGAPQTWQPLLTVGAHDLAPSTPTKPHTSSVASHDAPQGPYCAAHPGIGSRADQERCPKGLVRATVQTPGDHSRCSATTRRPLCLATPRCCRWHCGAHGDGDVGMTHSLVCGYRRQWSVWPVRCQSVGHPWPRPSCSEARPAVTISHLLAVNARALRPTLPSGAQLTGQVLM